MIKVEEFFADGAKVEVEVKKILSILETVEQMQINSERVQKRITDLEARLRQMGGDKI